MQPPSDSTGNIHSNSDTATAPMTPQANPSTSGESLKNNAPKRKKSTLPITAAFLAGAMTYAIFSAGYNLYIQTLNKNSDSSEVESTESKAITVQEETPTADSITQEELDAYAQTIDCSTKSTYSQYKVVYKKSNLSYIDVYNGVRISVTVGTSSRSFSAQWDNLPIVLDYKCNKISLSKIETGNIVNIYVDASETLPSSGNIANTRIIQKLTK